MFWWYFRTNFLYSIWRRFFCGYFLDIKRTQLPFRDISQKKQENSQLAFSLTQWLQHAVEFHELFSTHCFHALSNGLRLANHQHPEASDLYKSTCRDGSLQQRWGQIGVQCCPTLKWSNQRNIPNKRACFYWAESCRRFKGFLQKKNDFIQGNEKIFAGDVKITVIQLAESNVQEMDARTQCTILGNRPISRTMMQAWKWQPSRQISE